MIRLTSEDLRSIADMIDSREKYDNMCGYAVADIKMHPNGKKYLEFEQPCQYQECNSCFYRIEEKRG